MESPDVEENPDVWDLFRHYDKLYFRGALVNAAFTVDWRTKTTSCFGSCSFGKMRNTIILYQPMLQDRTSADLKDALLHLMIHAIIFVKHGLTCLSSHGPVFRDWMDALNACSVEDCMRPKRGYCITTTHDFSQEKLQSIQGNLWTCDSCGVTLVRAWKLGPPSDSCCIENFSQNATCGNMLCYWHNHKLNCGGIFAVPGKRGRLGHLSETSEMSKSEGKKHVSDSDEVPEFAASEKHEFISIGSHNNRKSSASNTSNKEDRWHKTEHVQTSIVQPSESQRKPKLEQNLAASEKYGGFSLGNFNTAKRPRSTTRRKEGKWHKAEGVEKSGVPLATPLKILKLEPGIQVAHGDAKPLGSSTEYKVGKLTKPECIRKATFIPDVHPRNLKQDLAASQNSELSSFVGRSNAHVPDNISYKKAHKVCEPEETRKLIARPAGPRSILKKKNETNSSVKAGKQHDPEYFRRTFFQPAVEQKQSNPVSPERPRTRSKTSSYPRKKEYACVSVWANIYESECSSGSAEPLVNKRTERRKRQRERSIQATAQVVLPHSADPSSLTPSNPSSSPSLIHISDDD